jgi:glycosyltransferase involved in cell wall biosynthesis
MSSVDVIVPCYRYGHFLRECVESVLRRSVQAVRVLIIDDASPDNTADVAAELVKEDSRVTFLRHSLNKGHIDTYNEGIEWASADYMLILSADDYLLPGALDRAANLMDAHPQVGFTFGNVIELSDNGTKTPVKSMVEVTGNCGQRILEGLEFIELSGSYCIVSTCTAVVRTGLQKRLGGYRRELPHAGDFEMWLRFGAHAPVGFVGRYQGIYRRHIANMSSQYYTNGSLADFQQRKAALDCFFETCGDVLPNSAQLRRRFFRHLSGHAVSLASSAFNRGEMEASRRVSEFALAICPEIDRSLGWLKLILKRRMGPRVWCALSPAVARIRGDQLHRR